MPSRAATPHPFRDAIPHHWMIVDRNRERAVRTAGVAYTYATGARVETKKRTKVINDKRVSMYAPPWVVAVLSSVEADIDCATLLTKIDQDPELFAAIESVMDAFTDSEFEMSQQLNRFLQPHME